MIKSTNFIDLLFILLCGTIVMLSQSLRLGGIEAKPAKVGGGAVSEIMADDVRIVGVSESKLAMEGRDFVNAVDVSKQLLPSAAVVLVPSNESVSHHRMMQVWSQFTELGWSPQIGVQKEVNVER